MATVRITGAESVGRLAVRVEGADAKLLAQTLNRFMAPTVTTVRRELATYTGAGYGRVSQVVTPRKASATVLTFQVDAKDGWMSLKEFKPREVRSGTSASPWAKRRLFTGAFMMGGRIGNRVPIPSLGGHVFVRAGKGRLPLHKLFGPNLAREMVRHDGAPLIAWQQDIGTLGPRIMREVKRRLEAGV
ncbi:hypothetical protein [Ancylobacter terrae]|uniref:hypothetical protein n=1 Tax=Ancylobacter sp. sgz301288 TaxID=3342077 RepID=UPI003858E6C4